LTTDQTTEHRHPQEAATTVNRQTQQKQNYKS